MTSLATRAEVVKLARELDTAPEDLAFLLESDAAAVRRVRQRMHRSLDAPHRPMFQRLAKVSALVPNTLAISIATRFFGPMLCGRIASSLTPERAVGLIGHVPVEFLADLAPYVDPDAAAPIVREFQSSVLVPVMRELLRRGDYVTLARFLVAATDQQLLDVVPHIDDAGDMLQVGFNAELDTVSDRFETVLSQLPDDRIRAIMLAAHEQDRFTEAFTFMQFLSARTLGRVPTATADMDDAVLIHMIEAVDRENAWAEMLPVAEVMSPPQWRRMFDLPVWDVAKLDAMGRAAEATGHGEELLQVIAEAGKRLD
ncbi:hypothetical protein [Nocardia sp. NPDC056100]|uniref:hypothetical protein n=1 Tax=Nocardia sp. NPDC056100 TaxID=3345712 RepID=UPI0035D5C89E